LHGIEIAGYMVPRLSVGGVDVALYKSYPLGAKDLSPLLKKVKAVNPDAVLAFSYPPGTILLAKQAKAIGLNPKLFFTSIGTSFSIYRDTFGANVVEGVMGMGAWNPKMPHPGAKEFWAAMEEHVGPGKTDWYGNAYCYSSLQVLEQAMERAGSIDRKAIRDIIANETFDTIIGTCKYVNQFNIQSAGEVGQWQNGKFETVAGKNKRTAGPIYPKPPWPE
jgi:branched-chain amino acid transport system substrate-binding protein